VGKRKGITFKVVDCNSIYLVSKYGWTKLAISIPILYTSLYTAHFSMATDGERCILEQIAHSLGPERSTNTF